jgi:hypothetical protein
MILVVVLWTVAVMTVIVVALSVYAQRSLSLAGVETKPPAHRNGAQIRVEAGGARFPAPVRSADILRRQAGARRSGRRPAGRYWHPRRHRAHRHQPGPAPLLAGLFTRAGADGGPRKSAEAIIAWRTAMAAAKKPTRRWCPRRGKERTSRRRFFSSPIYGIEAPTRRARQAALHLLYMAADHPMAPEPVLQSVPDMEADDIAGLFEARGRRNAEIRCAAHSRQTRIF